ncbi:hypothetical protein pb186bvf_014523 [Paramecium bursaria]
MKSPDITLPAISTKLVNKYYIARNFEQVNPDKSQDNIFSGVTQQEKGARFNPRGDIVKYSIVGKVDSYMKIKNGKQTKFDENTISKIPRSMVRIAEDQRSMPKSEIRSMTKLTSSGKIKKERRDQLTTKNQLLEEIDRIRLRIEANKLIEERKIDQLQPTLKRFVTKESRVQEKHFETERQWNQFMIYQADHLKRDVSACQLIQAEVHRNKLEAAAAFEAIKTDYERFGPRVWQMTLRKGDQQAYQKLKLKDETVLVENEQKFDFIVGSDLPNAFTESSVCGHKGSIEYMRKPVFTQESEMSVTSLPFKSFRSDEYLLKKIDKQKELFNQSLMVGIDKVSDFDQLVIIGKSQLDIEEQMVLGDGNDLTAVYRREIPNKPEAPVEEIIEMNYSGQQKLVLPPMKKSKRLERKDSDKQNESRSMQDFIDENINDKTQQ